MDKYKLPRFTVGKQLIISSRRFVHSSAEDKNAIRLFRERPIPRRRSVAEQNPPALTTLPHEEKEVVAHGYHAEDSTLSGKPRQRRDQ